MGFRQYPLRAIALTVLGAFCFGLAWRSSLTSESSKREPLRGWYEAAPDRLSVKADVSDLEPGLIPKIVENIPEQNFPAEEELPFQLPDDVSDPHLRPQVAAEITDPSTSTVSDDVKQTISQSLTAFHWQKVFTDFYVYSVYPNALDSSDLHVVLFGPNRDNQFWSADVCSCVYYSTDLESSLNNITVKGRLEVLPESKPYEGHNIGAGRLKCPFPREAVQQPLLDVRCQHGSKSGAATFRTPAVMSEPPPKLTFALCGLIHGFVNEQQAVVIEYIEYYRLMGVTKIFWQGIDVGDKTRKLLQYYEDEGVMEFREWKVPYNRTAGDSAHYYGQVAAQYDCIMRTAGLFDYTIIADLDEYYATTRQPPTFASITNNGDSDCVLVQSVFMDPHGNYSGDTFDPESGDPVLRTALITLRSSLIHGQDERSKYLCRMRKVDIPQIHTVQRNRGQAATVRPSPDETILLHYRQTNEPGSVKERRASVLSPQLQPRVAAVWKTVYA
ncbi:hypothetical protein BV898_15346 [Hypsibius exemplaris]|uniref:Glycosyltransferase family 92 protein n=1 Tax=Hypsibius exemplaris TaxID=2072580 RepID=A0A9X6RKM1_HYPEX|nr:hypothetical protein BV898_15346 [Hypsibius exemplaris]